MTISSYEVRAKTRAQIAPSAIKILSNVHRYSIMKLLFTTRGDLCVHELSEAIGLSQSATSHQLAHLEARGAVKSVRMGKTKCYLPTDTPLAKKVARVIRTLA